jgi:hypothetical protein
VLRTWVLLRVSQHDCPCARHKMGHHNIHMLLHDSVTVFLILRANQIFILFTGVLPCCFAMLHNMLDSQLFLQLQLVQHKSDTLLFHVLGVKLLLQPQYLLQKRHILVIVISMANRVCLTHSGLPRLLYKVDEIYCIEM